MKNKFKKILILIMFVIYFQSNAQDDFFNPKIDSGDLNYFDSLSDKANFLNALFAQAKVAVSSNINGKISILEDTAMLLYRIDDNNYTGTDDTTSYVFLFSTGIKGATQSKTVVVRTAPVPIPIVGGANSLKALYLMEFIGSSFSNTTEPLKGYSARGYATINAYTPPFTDSDGQENPNSLLPNKSYITTYPEDYGTWVDNSDYFFKSILFDVKLTVVN
jgi:hypothetical protein